MSEDLPALVLYVDGPTEDHPLWASRPDTESNTRTAADTWRCKERHGGDCKGVDGAYRSSSHRTDIGGMFDTSLSAQEVFDLVETDHAYGGAGVNGRGSGTLKAIWVGEFHATAL